MRARSQLQAHQLIILSVNSTHPSLRPHCTLIITALHSTLTQGHYIGDERQCTFFVRRPNWAPRGEGNKEFCRWNRSLPHPIDTGRTRATRGNWIDRSLRNLGIASITRYFIRIHRLAWRKRRIFGRHGWADHEQESFRSPLKTTRIFMTTETNLWTDWKCGGGLDVATSTIAAPQLRTIQERIRREAYGWCGLDLGAVEVGLD